MDRNLDQLLGDSGFPDPDDDAVQRISAAVLARVSSRRQRLRRLRWSAAALVAAAAVAVFLWRLPHGPPESPGSKPSPVAEPGRALPPPESPSPQLVRVERPPAEERPQRRLRSPRRIARDFWTDCSLFLASWQGTREDGAFAAFLRNTLADLPNAAVEIVARDLARRWSRRSGGRQKVEVEFFIAELGRSNAPEAWPILTALLETRGPEPIVLAALGDHGDPRAVPALERWLFLCDRRSVAAAAALGRIPGEESLTSLLKAASSLRGAGGLLAPKLATEVTTALRERESEVCDFLFEASLALRPLALRALSELASEKALSAVIQALEDRALHATARRCLSRIANRDLGPRPERWSRWLSESVDRGKERA